MKAYIITFALEDSNPLIWRKVVMPADATFHRLHQTIQRATNFTDSHLYEFNLRNENILVTNNEELHENFQYQKKNKLKPKLEVKKPTGIKIDHYLENYKEVHYMYDFGDSWTFLIKLDDIVEDYYFGYPTLLDGAETAPPDDVGGVHGYQMFLEIYNNPRNPDYSHMQEWAEGQRYEAYNPEWINDYLKTINYKKTEWDKINHDNYYIIEDKYRKN